VVHDEGSSDGELAGSGLFGKFLLFDFSSGYNPNVLIGSDPKCPVQSVELLRSGQTRFERKAQGERLCCPDPPDRILQRIDGQDGSVASFGTS